MWYRNSLTDEKEISPYIAQTNSSQDVITVSGRLSDSPRLFMASVLLFCSSLKALAFPRLAKSLTVSQNVNA
jgi:hypothetical protein